MSRTKHILFGGAATLLALLPGGAAASSESMPRGPRPAPPGAHKAEVIIKCGAPERQDDWADELIEHRGVLGERFVNTERERWIYNFGANSFLRFLLFENGRLVEIATGERGYDERRSAAGPCDPGRFHVGLSQYELLQQCGAPFFKDSRREEREFAVSKGVRKRVLARIEEWTYNLGPDQFLRILTFENNKQKEKHTNEHRNKTTNNTNTTRRPS